MNVDRVKILYSWLPLAKFRETSSILATHISMAEIFEQGVIINFYKSV